MNKLFFILSVLVVGMLVFSACSPKAEPIVEEVEPTAVAQEVSNAPVDAAQTLIMAADISSVITFDPQVMCEQIPSMLFSLIYETLVNLDPNDFSKVVPYLAESWEISEDLRTYTFHLFPDAKFASGNPVTAEDVKFTFDRDRKDPATCYGSYLAPVESVTVVDDLTVQITTIKPDAAFLILLSTSGFGIVEKAAVVANGGSDDPAATDTAKAWFDQNSPGSGPYVLTKWEPNAEIVFEANPNWWGGTPNLSRFLVKHVEDPTLSVQMLQTGDADLVWQLDLDLIDAVQADANLALTTAQDVVTTYLAMNTSPTISEPLSNKLVRQAIVAAVNKDAIIDSLFKGYATRAPSIISVGELGVNPEDIKPRDVELAKQLLKEAGYEDGFTVQFYYSSTNATTAVVAAAIQSDLAEVGITVELMPTETSVYLSLTRAGEAPFFVGSWGPDTPDPTQLTDIFCYKDVVIGKYLNADMPEATPLCDQLHTEFDPAKRAEMVQQITDIFNDYMAFTQLYQKQLVLAHTKAVTNIIYLPGRFVDLSKIMKQ